MMLVLVIMSPDVVVGDVSDGRHILTTPVMHDRQVLNRAD
jgi:hypothetical protein